MIGVGLGGALRRDARHAARMHDFRFKQMEYTPPEEYQDEPSCSVSAASTTSLITTGPRADQRQLHGRHALPLPGARRPVRGPAAGRPQLGGDRHRRRRGQAGPGGDGRSRHRRGARVHPGVGGERVLRRIRPTSSWSGTSTGSGRGHRRRRRRLTQSFAGLRAALELGKRFQRRVEAVAVYDPYLHYAVFKRDRRRPERKGEQGLRFKEQEALHEEIIAPASPRSTSRTCGWPRRRPGRRGWSCPSPSSTARPSTGCSAIAASGSRGCS